MPHGSLSAFKATLARKKSRDVNKKSFFDKNKSAYKTSETKTEYNFPKLSESELLEVKGNIRKRLKSDRKKSLIRSGLFIICFLTLLLFLLLKFL